MRLLKHVMTTGLVGVVLVAGVARETSAAPTPATSVAVAVDDSMLQSQITAKLKADAALAARDITVDVKQGVVTLTGSVRTATGKANAERIARVTGVTTVNNRIEVDPNIDVSKVDTAAEKTKAGLTKAVDATVSAAKKTKEGVQKGVGKSEEAVGKAADKTSDAVGKVGDKMSDTSVTTRVKTAFSGDGLLQGATIDVSTADHVVTLKGSVASNSARARAGELARSTEGVSRVINQLVVNGD